MSEIKPDTTNMEVKGKIFSRHIEEPLTTFVVRVLRAPSWNVLFRPAAWEMWKVLAETQEGAMKIAKYHFHRSDNIEFLGEA